MSIEYKDSLGNDIESGNWYHLYQRNRGTPLLVYCYFSMDYRCIGFSFNAINGGQFIPLIDIKGDEKYKDIKPIIITEEQ